MPVLRIPVAEVLLAVVRCCREQHDLAPVRSAPPFAPCQAEWFDPTHRSNPLVIVAAAIGEMAVCAASRRSPPGNPRLAFHRCSANCDAPRRGRRTSRGPGTTFSSQDRSKPNLNENLFFSSACRVPYSGNDKRMSAHQLNKRDENNHTPKTVRR